eukprot:7001660-Alexandrium_andersonii.AAC.1
MFEPITYVVTCPPSQQLSECMDGSRCNDPAGRISVDHGSTSHGSQCDGGTTGVAVSSSPSCSQVEGSP